MAALDPLAGRMFETPGKQYVSCRLNRVTWTDCNGNVSSSTTSEMKKKHEK
jgi:hypothetical protein